jgi:hypothetical protein
LWDKRRTLPRCAEDFPALLAAHIRQVFPHTQPAEGETADNVTRYPGLWRRRRARG